MSYTSATAAQRQAAVNTLITASKIIKTIHEGGSPLKGRETELAAALSAAATALVALGSTGLAANQSVVTTATAVSVPVTFTTAKTAGQVATVAVTPTVVNGAITAFTVA